MQDDAAWMLMLFCEGPSPGARVRFIMNWLSPQLGLAGWNFVSPGSLKEEKRGRSV